MLRIILKLLGAGFILLGAFAYGRQSGNVYRKRIKLLRHLWECLEYMQNEIHYKSTTIEELCSQLAQKETGVIKAFFEHIQENMKIRNWSFAKAGLCEIENLVENTEIKHGQLWPLEELVENYEMQEKSRLDDLLTLCVKRLQQEEYKQLEEYKGKERMYRSLSLCAGFLGIIILL